MTLKEITEERDRLNKEIQELEQKEFEETELPGLRKLIGTYWKYLNSYDGNKNWWLYLHITDVNNYGDKKGLKVQIDCYGNLRIEKAEWVYIDDWIKSSREEFDAVVKEARQLIDNL